MKESLLKGYGGNKLTEEAVDGRSRVAIPQQDRKDGSWSLKGPYSSGSPI